MFFQRGQVCRLKFGYNFINRMNLVFNALPDKVDTLHNFNSFILKEEDIFFVLSVVSGETLNYANSTIKTEYNETYFVEILTKHGVGWLDAETHVQKNFQTFVEVIS